MQVPLEIAQEDSFKHSSFLVRDLWQILQSQVRLGETYGQPYGRKKFRVPALSETFCSEI